MQCKHCLHKFTGGASCIGDNYVHSTPACGVSQGEQVPENLLALTQQEREQPWLMLKEEEEEEEEEGSSSGGDSDENYSRAQQGGY